MNEPVRTARTECEELVRSFDSHLQHVAGLMPGTRTQYLRHTNLFVKAVFGTEAFEITKVTPQAISDFVCEQAAKLKPSFCAAPDLQEGVSAVSDHAPRTFGGDGWRRPDDPPVEAGVIAQASVHGTNGPDIGNLRRAIGGRPAGPRDLAPPCPACAPGRRSCPPPSLRYRLARRRDSNPSPEIRSGTKAAPAE